MKVNIDFFSDSNIDPSTEMRKAMAEAKVGNEVACEDPTVNELVSELHLRECFLVREEGFAM